MTDWEHKRKAATTPINLNHNQPVNQGAENSAVSHVAHVDAASLQAQPFTAGTVASTVQTLQRAIGNRAVAHLLKSRNPESSHELAGPTGVRNPVSSVPLSNLGRATGSVQRKENLVQRAAKASNLNRVNVKNMIQRWPFDSDGTDLKWSDSLNKFNTMVGGAGGFKNWAAEKASGIKMPAMAGRAFQGIDVLNTANQFRREGLTEDSVASGMSTALNFVPPLAGFNAVRGGYDALMTGAGKDNWTSTAMMSNFVKSSARGYANSTPEERRFEQMSEW